MVNLKFYNAYKQTFMLMNNISEQELQREILSGKHDINLDCLDLMAEDFEMYKSLKSWIENPSINGKTKECIIVMEKILLGKL